MALTVYMIFLLSIATWTGFVSETAAAGEASCSIPSVKKGKATQLRCLFDNANISDTDTVTVNAHAGSGTGADFAVLTLKKAGQAWGKPVMYRGYEFRNISLINADGMKWELVIDIQEVTADYEGEYSCQLPSADSLNLQNCHLLMDRVELLIQNGLLVLHLDLHDVDDGRKQHYLMRRVQLRNLSTRHVLRDDTLPEPSSNFTSSIPKNNTKYEMAVYMGDESQISVIRSICIPTVSNLHIDTTESGSVRAEWDPSPVCKDNVASETYQVCYKKADSDVPCDDECFNKSEKASVEINNVTHGTKYTVCVRAVLIPSGYGPFTTMEAYMSEEPLDKGNNELGGGEIAAIIIAVLCIIVAALALTMYLKRRSKQRAVNKHVGGAEMPMLGTAPDMVDRHAPGQVMCPEHLSLTAPGLDTGGELANDLSPDSGFDPEPEQESEDIRTLRENYQRIERENNQQKTEIQDLKEKLRQMTDQLKEAPKHAERHKELDAMTNKCRELQDKFQKEKKEMEDKIAKLQKQIEDHEHADSRDQSAAMQDHINTFKRWEKNAIKDKEEQLKQRAEELEHRNEEIAFLKSKVEDYEKQLQNLRRESKDPYLQKRNRDHGNRQHDQYKQGVQKDQADSESEEEDKCMGVFKRPNNPLVNNGGRLEMGGAASDMQPSTSGKQASVSKLTEDNKLLSTASMGAAPRTGTTKESSPPLRRQTSLPASDSPDLNIIHAPAVADIAGPRDSVEPEGASGFQTSAEERTRPPEVNPSSTAALTHQLSSSAGLSVHPGT